MNVLSNVDGINVEQLCDNSAFMRRGGGFNFSKNRDAVYRGNTASAKELENKIIVDTCYSKTYLLEKIRDILIFFDLDVELIIKLQG